MSPAPLSIPTAWGCCIIWIIVVLGQSKFVDSRPTVQSVNFEICHNISKRMVIVVTDTLTQLQNLNRDFNCSYTSVALQSEALSEMNTLSACLPQTCVCSNSTILAPDKDRCLMAIHSDVKTFRSKLQSVNLILSPLNKVTEEMIETLKRYDDGKGVKKQTNLSEFGREMKQCTAVLRFRWRAITISRIIGHLKDEASKHHSH